MNESLEGKRVAFLATDGVEQVELTSPWQAVQAAGAQPVLLAPKTGQIQGFNHLDRGEAFAVDQALADARPADFDALVLPGGVINGDALRLSSDAVQFARAFVESGKPVAAICHGGWLLVEAAVVQGRTLTSWPSLKTDICNAGGRWVDQAVYTDRNLVTSRKPDDLPQFNQALLNELRYSVAAGPVVAPANEDTVTEGSDLSFPASDPPSWMPPTSI